MPRKIQLQSGRSDAGMKSFAGLLVNAIFWLVLALVLPVGAIVDVFPEVAPYTHWAPVLFYTLAFWSFIRAVRTVQRFAAGRVSSLARPKAASSPPERRPANSRRARTHASPPITRTPTVQRMR
jgi:hypothetical protein